MADDIRRAAMDIVVAEEWLAGRRPEPIRGTHLERIYGCDILVYVEEREEPDRVEVKGWGDPLIATRGAFSWRQDLQVSQYEAACSGAPFRVEIVANLRAFLGAGGNFDRLTVHGDFVRNHGRPSAYEVALDPLKDDIRRSRHPAFTNDQLHVSDVPPPTANWDEIGRFAITYPGWTAPEWRRDGEADERLCTTWQATGALPDDLTRLRLALFWEQRQYRHSGEAPDDGDLQYLRALVEKIRQILRDT
jgi:hypothetical protein